MTTTYRALLLATLVIAPLGVATSPAQADTLVIVVHPDNPTAALGNSDLMRLWMGKTRQFPGGTPAVPASLSASDPSRTLFDATVLNKTSNQVRAYWAQQIFTGRGTPPREFASVNDLRDWVANTPEAIAYLPEQAVDKSVRIVQKIP